MWHYRAASLTVVTWRMMPPQYLWNSSMNHLLLCFIKQAEFDQMTVFTSVTGDTFYSLIGFEFVFFAFDVTVQWPGVIIGGHKINNSLKAEQYKLCCTVNVSLNRTWLKYLLCHTILSWLWKWQICSVNSSVGQVYSQYLKYVMDKHLLKNITREYCSVYCCIE